MGNITAKSVTYLTLSLIIALLIVQPVFADIPKTLPASTDTISIAYRGSGGFYVGNTIIFDGRNTVGNTTLVKITGSGLPAEGVPLYDLNGEAGSGNPVNVDPDSTWRLVWDTSSINGLEKLQTTRYTVTAMDLAHPENIVATTVYLKKPEFSIVAQPDTLEAGNYVQLSGNAENGVSSVKIEVTDMSGKVLKTFECAVSASGYFNNGFHADMQPGQYYVVITNPVLKKTSRTVLTIVKPEQPPLSPVTTSPAPPVTITVPSTLVYPTVTAPGSTSAVPSGTTGTLTITSTPPGATVYVDARVAGVTPLTLNDIAAGTHQIEIQSPDYQTSSLSVTVKAGETASVSPILQKSTSALPVYVLAIIGVVLVVCIVAAVILTTRRKPSP